MTELALPPFPLPPDKWQDIAEQLKFSPTHMKIVELILLNRCIKQIEAELDMPHGTLRSHMERIFHKARVSDQKELVILLCALSHGIRRP